MAVTRVAVTLAVALVVLPGCLTVTPAHVPDSVLRQHAGWETDPDHSQSEPTGGRFSVSRQQALAYQDEGESGDGYAASLSVITLRTVVTVDEESLLDQVQALVKDAAESRGIRVDGEATKGERDLANGASSRFFVYNGTVTQESGLFTRDAKTKILGEVFRCRAERTSVVVVGLAQVTDSRSIGGVPFPSNQDPATWHEIVRDPTGTIEGVRGRGGLAYSVACG